MVQNASVTAFTVSELLSENQQLPQPRLGLRCFLSTIQTFPEKMQCVFQLIIFLPYRKTVGLIQLSFFLVSAFFCKGLM